ncbi:hypothetical protein SMIDD26_00807 [Streptococcus mitis]|uniref:Uncharacterized protein n=1 Tax=Streptococcus mitis TaxID=28037 RepID=A0A139PTV0_STRMT|nr:hypothetical protein SMIDD26_00807 [Streptococcus mitis]
MRGNIGRHPNGNTSCSINQKIRKARWQDQGFTFIGIIVINEVNRILIDITKHLQSNLAHTCLSITLGGSTISIHGTKVSMPIYKHVTVTPPLSHTDHGFIDRGIPVWVIFTHDIPCNTSRFFMRFVWSNTQFIHSIENATVNRFQAISNIRKSPRYDNTHGVIDKARLHLLCQIDIH